MASTQWKPPTNTGETYNDWTNPTNAYVDNASYAQFGGTGSAGLYVAISGNGGSSYTSSKEITDLTETNPTTHTLGGAADVWGGSWTVDTLKDTNFRMYLSDNSAAPWQEQDYYDFGFFIPAGSTIDGIEVRVKGFNVYYFMFDDYDINVRYIDARIHYTEPVIPEATTPVVGNKYPHPAFKIT